MKTIHLTKLQNTEHLALMTDVLKLLKEANIDALAPLKTAFEKQVKASEEAQKQIRKNEHTSDLVSLDEKRDRIYRGLVLRLQSEELAEVEERRAAAKKVSLVINTYGNFTKFNYRKETAEIYNLISDLNSDEYRPAMQKVGIEEWVNWLDTVNKAFETLYDQRRDDYAEQPTVDVKNIRKELDTSFKKIQEMTRALVILQPSETLNTFISKTNATINKWKEVLAQRIPKKPKKNETKEEGKEEK